MCRFLRELSKLKQMADYESCDPTHLDDWLKELGVEFRQYTYQMLKSGVDRRVLRLLSDDHLLRDCAIVNGVHRLRILDAGKRQCKRLFSASAILIHESRQLLRSNSRHTTHNISIH